VDSSQDPTKTGHVESYGMRAKLRSNPTWNKTEKKKVPQYNSSPVEIKENNMAIQDGK
jgi:hypothetical protein